MFDVIKNGPRLILKIDQNKTSAIEIALLNFYTKDQLCAKVTVRVKCSIHWKSQAASSPIFFWSQNLSDIYCPLKSKRSLTKLRRSLPLIQIMVLMFRKIDPIPTFSTKFKRTASPNFYSFANMIYSNCDWVIVVFFEGRTPVNSS